MTGRSLVTRAVRWLLLLLPSACSPGAPLTVDDELPSLWSEDFEGTDGSLEAHDPSWRPIFGRLNVRDGALVADPGEEDGDDDYGYRPQPATDVLISADVYWDRDDAVGVELVCPPGAVHESLYELTLYQGELQLLRYDGGGDPSVYRFLRSTGPLGLDSGRYTLVLRARHDGGRWRLRGELYDPAAPGRALATVGDVRDDALGPSIGQGIGFYNRSEEASRVYAVEVRGR